MKKLNKKENFCILDNDYFSIIMEVASNWVMVPYSPKHSQVAWYRRKWFSKKITGCLLTGFKMEYPKDEIKTANPEMQELTKAINTLNNAPIAKIFVPEHIYDKIESMQGNGCMIECTEYGMVKIRHKYFGKISVFCLMGANFVKELTDAEISYIKSVDTFVAGE